MDDRQTDRRMGRWMTDRQKNGQMDRRMGRYANKIMAGR
jgi:hypothetical protein